MDPAKLIGKVKEVVRMEHKSRSNYPHVWTNVAEKETNKFYNQNEIDRQLKDKQKLQATCPYKHDGKGDAHFISPEMHKQLVEICRCGRPRQGLHMGKCLQRAVNPHLEQQPDEAGAIDVPRTSNSTIGFRSASYKQLEQSMQYVSPTHSMPGPRITAAPYNVIIIVLLVGCFNLEVTSFARNFATQRRQNATHFAPSLSYSGQNYSKPHYYQPAVQQPNIGFNSNHYGQQAPVNPGYGFQQPPYYGYNGTRPANITGGYRPPYNGTRVFSKLFKIW